MEDAVKHKTRVHQLDFIGASLQGKVKIWSLVKLGSRYAEYLPKYSGYFGRALKLLNYMYGRNNSGKLFADELTEWFLEVRFIEYQCHISIYYKYAPDEKNSIVLSYVYYCVQ